jgi:hypothetical protein
MMGAEPQHIGILLFDDVEELDAPTLSRSRRA